MLLLTPPHQNHSPNQPPNRSQSQGTLTSAIPVEVFCYLLYALDFIRPNSTWVMFCTQQPDFSAALSIQSMFPMNIAVAYLSEEKSIPESCATDLRAAVSNCDTVAPIQWERVCEDLANGFPVDCTGRRYVDQEEEATQPEEEDGESQEPPPPQVNRQEGGRHTRQGQEIKGWSKPLTAKPQTWIKASNQQGVGHVCSPFQTVPADTEWKWCHWWC